VEDKVKKVYFYNNYSPKEALRTRQSAEDLAALVTLLIALEAVRPGTILDLLLKVSLVNAGWTFHSSIRPEDRNACNKAQDDFLELLDEITRPSTGGTTNNY